MDKKNILALVDVLRLMCRRYNVCYDNRDYDLMRINDTMIDGFCFALDGLSIDYHFNRSNDLTGRFISFSVDGVIYYDID